VAGKAAGTRAGECKLPKSVSGLLKPDAQDLCCFSPKGDGAFFAPLAVQFQ
jgi:hypothetical protein